ncbi:YetF domain-containing protein [Paenibacillus sp. GCM10028914]|uniref:YetF domain-containing protein n=1 Tax=Paenibacillus sp. GCM10028914 TaxID=3273416 RepID=UPI003622A474
MDFGMTAIKLVIGFLGLWLLTRLLGKKEISNLTPFDFVSSLLLSDIVGETLYAEEIRYSELVLALGVWFTLSYIFEKITQHAKKLRGPLEGTPSIIIRNGEVDLKEMKRNKVDFEQLRMMLRQKEIFSLREVAYAIFETNGSLSVLKNSLFDNVERGDLKLPEEPKHLSCCLVENGVIDEDNLSRIGKDKSWLSMKLREQGCSDPSELAYAEWMEGKDLFIIRGCHS